MQAYLWIVILIIIVIKIVLMRVLLSSVILPLICMSITYRLILSSINAGALLAVRLVCIILTDFNSCEVSL
jgi:hypothetical protein